MPEHHRGSDRIGQRLMSAQRGKITSTGWCAICVFAIVPAVAMAAGDADHASSIVFMQVPALSEQGAYIPLDKDVELPTGSRIATIDTTGQAASLTVLTERFAAAGYPDVAHDGKHILFVGKKTPESRVHLWEMNLRTGQVRQVTGDNSPPVAPRPARYLSTLFTIDCQSPTRQLVYSTAEDGGTLYRCNEDGGDTTRISYYPYGLRDPFQLHDGRLIAAAQSPPTPASASKPPHDDDRAACSTAWLSLHIDGTDVFPFAGLYEKQRSRSMPCQMPDGRVVYVEGTPDCSDLGGSLVSVDPARSLHTRRLLIDADNGYYRTPSRAGAQELLVAYREASTSQPKPYGLWLVDLNTRSRVRLIHKDAHWHNIGPQLIAPRRTPHGRSSVVDRSSMTAQLYCMDSYLSDQKDVQSIRKGQIKRVRFYRPKQNRGTGSAIAESILGEAPVEADGSFFLELPALLPFRLETLDADGHTLARMKHWIWVMPGEGRGCIGCHEDRALAPPNRHVQALRRRPTPVGMTDATLQE